MGTVPFAIRLSRNISFTNASSQSSTRRIRAVTGHASTNQTEPKPCACFERRRDVVQSFERSSVDVLCGAPGWRRRAATRIDFKEIFDAS